MATAEKTPGGPGWETARLIGRGSFGAVYEIRRSVFGETERCALKYISIPQDDSEIRDMKSEGMDDASYIRLSERLRTASSNYKPNPTYQHIHHGALENVFVNYVKDKSNSVGFKVAFIFSPTFLERFVGQAFRDKYIVLANSGIGYKGQFDYKPQQPRV